MEELAWEVRNLGLFLYNEHGFLEASIRLTKIMSEVFALLPAFSEKVSEDITALDQILLERQNKKVREEEEKRKREEDGSDLLESIYNLCQTALNNTEKLPSTGDMEVVQVIEASLKLLSEMVSKKVHEKILQQGMEILAVTIMRCSIAFGNKTEKWGQCEILLTKAKEYAINSELLARIEEGLTKVRENSSFGSFTTPSSAPKTSSLMGEIIDYLGVFLFLGLLFLAMIWVSE